MKKAVVILVRLTVMLSIIETNFNERQNPEFGLIWFRALIERRDNGSMENNSEVVKHLDTDATE